MAKVTLLNPFDTGSHRQWAAGLQFHSAHSIKTASLPHGSWRWRMLSSGIDLQSVLAEEHLDCDILLATDLMDSATLLASQRSSLNNVKLITYFHENQLTYPWSQKERHREERQRIFGYLNFRNAVVSDICIFNSEFNRSSFLNALPAFLKSLPTQSAHHKVEEIERKSRVIYPGLELPDLNRTDKKSRVPSILWNHRWEYDKDPTSFFEALKAVKARGLEFSLVMLGESGHDQLEVFRDAKVEFANEISHWGYVESRQEYWELLQEADILPVVSRHDFFGLSVLEAVWAGCRPLLPKRLTYPELFPPELFSDCFYEDHTELVNRIADFCDGTAISAQLDDSLRARCSDFCWSNIIVDYDSLFETVSKVVETEWIF